jgi:hypothetical protein
MRPQRGWRALSGRKRRGALLAGRGGAWTSGRGGRKKENSRGVEGNAVWVGKAAGRARVCRERGKRGEEG